MSIAVRENGSGSTRHLCFCATLIRAFVSFEIRLVASECTGSYVQQTIDRIFLANAAGSGPNLSGVKILCRLERAES
jgi:hypothetical protein